MSSIIDLKSFRFTKYSLKDLKEKDWLIDLVDFLNTETASDKYSYFYDLLPNLRFLKPKDGVVAYTNKASEIFMNSPGVFGKDMDIWLFIYFHECLHQLWETFGVAQEIEDSGRKVDHYTLNIASDCIINDFLRGILNKKAPKDGIFPEVLKKEFGVEYDREEDTQFTLYLKLIEAQKQDDDLLDKLKELVDKLTDAEDHSGIHSDDMDMGDNDEESDIDDEDIDDEEDTQDNEGNPDLDSKKDLTDSDDTDGEGKGGTDKNGTEPDKDGSDSESDSNGEAGSDSDTPEDLPKEDGKGSKGMNIDGKKGGSTEDNSSDKNTNNSKDKESGKQSVGSGGSGHGEGMDGDIASDAAAAARKRTDKVLKKHKQSLSSPIGDFVKKCKLSKLLKENKVKGQGLNIKTGTKGDNSWDKAMNITANTFVAKQVAKIKREYKKTYMRPKRGTTPKIGQPVTQGRQKKHDKINVSVAFYIDNSGSMWECIDQVLDCVWKLSDELSGKYDKAQTKTDFKYYTFNERINEIKYHASVHSGGGTLAFERLFEKIKEGTGDAMINVILTDADMDCDKAKVLKYLNDAPNLFIFISNNENQDFIEISKEVKKKNLVYIQADREFNVE